MKWSRKTFKKKARFDRKYDKVNEGDLARVYKKPGKYSEFGFDFDHWKKGNEKVEGFDNDDDGIRTYKLSNVARPLMRHELKLIRGSETPVLVQRRLSKKAPPRYEVR